MRKIEEKKDNVEWKELKIDKLPEDILTGDYEFEFKYIEDYAYSACNWTALSVIEHIVRNHTFSFQYRKPEPKAPTHEEIMTKWWYIPEAHCWGKVISYSGHRYGITVMPNETFKDIDIIYRNKEAFIYYRSADIPPEE
jgi:hypothetical protein